MYPNTRQQNASTSSAYPGHSNTSTPAPYQYNNPTSAAPPLPPVPSAAYAAYNDTTNYNQAYPQTQPHDYAQNQTHYDPPTSAYPNTSSAVYAPTPRSNSTPYSAPAQTYAEPASYIPQQSSYPSTYQTAPQQPQQSFPYDNPSSAYEGIEIESAAEEYHNPYYSAAPLQPNPTGFSVATSQGTALPQYRSEAGSYAIDRLPSPGASRQNSQDDRAQPLSQSWNGQNTNSSTGVGRQRTISPRGPRHMSRSHGPSEAQEQLDGSQQYENRW